MCKPRSSEWRADLQRVRDGELSFGALVRLHSRLIGSVVNPWRSYCPASITVDDLQQEAWIAVWQALADWQEARGSELGAYVLRQAQYRMMHVTRGLRAERERMKEVFVHFAVVEEVVTETIAQYERCRDKDKRARRVIGKLTSKEGRVIAALLEGDTIDQIVAQVYSVRHKRPRKAVFRAVATACVHMESLLTRENGESEWQGRVRKSTMAKQLTLPW